MTSWADKVDRFEDEIGMAVHEYQRRVRSGRVRPKKASRLQEMRDALKQGRTLKSARATRKETAIENSSASSPKASSRGQMKTSDTLSPQAQAQAASKSQEKTEPSAPAIAVAGRKAATASDACDISPTAKKDAKGVSATEPLSEKEVLDRLMPLTSPRVAQIMCAWLKAKGAPAAVRGLLSYDQETQLKQLVAQFEAKFTGEEQPAAADASATSEDIGEPAPQGASPASPASPASTASAAPLQQKTIMMRLRSLTSERIATMVCTFLMQRGAPDSVRTLLENPAELGGLGAKFEEKFGNKSATEGNKTVTPPAQEITSPASESSQAEDEKWRPKLQKCLREMTSSRTNGMITELLVSFVMSKGTREAIENLTKDEGALTRLVTKFEQRVAQCKATETKAPSRTDGMPDRTRGGPDEASSQAGARMFATAIRQAHKERSSKLDPTAAAWTPTSSS